VTPSRRQRQAALHVVDSSVWLESFEGLTGVRYFANAG